MIGRWLDVAAPLWIHLAPLSPAKTGLSPSRPGTVFFNVDNGLDAFSWFVPVVPGKNESYPEALAANVKFCGRFEWWMLAGFATCAGCWAGWWLSVQSVVDWVHGGAVGQ